MNRRIILGILLALVLITGAVSLGAYAYNIGIAQGLAQSATLNDLSPGAQAVPYPYYGGPFWFYRPFGFGPFACFGPFLFVFIIFFLVRGLWWGGRWGHHGPGWKHGQWDRSIPPMFEAWHRQAHGQEAAPTPPTPVE